MMPTLKTHRHLLWQSSSSRIVHSSSDVLAERTHHIAIHLLTIHLLTVYAVNGIRYSFW